MPSKDNQDKKSVEIKSGLEIHQQLDTSKLFCRCPSLLRKEKPDYFIERKLHVVAGETGSVDDAVRFESLKNKSFVYECYNDNVCLVDIDEEPPCDVNEEALEIAIQISLLLNCEIIQRSQIMRKTVIDGSNVSGFQRTFLLAKEGYVETSFGKVRIESIALEEDAARLVKKEKDKITYRLDRLGIPLVEIATYPDIKSAEQAKEVALKIGEVLRACKVRRGIGTIRQDVNISVCSNDKWGSRVEIKGVQEPGLIEKTLINETQRQISLIKKNKSIEEVRKALIDGNTEYLRPLPGASRMYPETDLPFLYISLDKINQAKKSLPKLRTEIRNDLSKKGLNSELVSLVLKEKKFEDFEELLQIYPEPEIIAKMLTLWAKEIKNKLKSKQKNKITIDVIETILASLKKQDIEKSDIRNIMLEYAQGNSLKEILNKPKENSPDLEEEVLKILKEKPGLSENAYMGLLMKKFKGNINPKKASEVIKSLIE
jgi:Glu-tRNA(Gln) amidotransferase subunit E-like FAD-binding protein